MKKDWPTKDKDMHIAQIIMEEYAHQSNSDALGLFELVVDKKAKRMDFRLADWVTHLAKQFSAMYGANRGDFVTRQVISQYITQEHTIH